MKERVYTAEISDIKLEATIFDHAFFFKSSNPAMGLMTEIKYLHEHSSYEVFLVLDGSLTVFEEQGKYEYENSLIIIPPHFNHYTVSNVSNGYTMYFRIEQNTKKRKELFPSLYESLNERINTLPLDEDVIFYTRRLAYNIESGGSDDDNAHLIALIFSSVFRHFRSDPIIPQSISTQKHAKYLFTIDNYIIENYTKRITLEDLAAKLFLCPRQVSRIIRKEYGCSLTTLVNRRKLNVARMLIKNTNLNIGDIASMVGYEYENYFYTLFKKEYGMSPQRYRESLD